MYTTLHLLKLLALHPNLTTQHSHISQGGAQREVQTADVACGKHMIHEALSHVSVSESSGFTV